MKAGPDPERLMASEAASESLRAALRSAKTDVPGNDELRALAATLAPQLGSGGTGGAGGASGAGGAGAKAGLGGIRWMIASGVIVGGVALLVALRAPRSSVAPMDQGQGPAETASPVVVDTPARPEAREVEAPAASPAQPVREEPAEAGNPRSGDTSKPRVAAPLPERTAAPSAAGKAEAAPKPGEAALLDGARKALQNDPRQALALTEQHRALYPKGLLAQEREVIAIEALRKLGEQQAARQRSEEFDARYPTTIHGREVETEADAGKK